MPAQKRCWQFQKKLYFCAELSGNLSPESRAKTLKPEVIRLISGFFYALPLRSLLRLTQPVGIEQQPDGCKINDQRRPSGT